MTEVLGLEESERDGTSICLRGSGEWGDWIIADDDGAVAVSAQQAEATLARGEALIARDARVPAAMRVGASLYEAWEPQSG